jgi:hypothetical protein
MPKILTGFVVFLSLLLVPALAEATCNVKDFGAVGDGAADDRLAVQAAIDSCKAAGDKDVYVPRGTYLLSRAGNAYYNLKLKDVNLRGDGDNSILMQGPNMFQSVRLLFVEGDGLHIRDLVLDGNKSAHPLFSEHRHGIFANGAKRLTVTNVEARNFTGDGIYFYVGADHSVVQNSYIHSNDRDGIALAQNLTGSTIINNRIVFNRVQQIDSEPVGTATVNNIRIIGNYLESAPGDHGGDFVLTVSGPSSLVRSRGWTIQGNTMMGPVFLVWVEDITFTGNTIEHGKNKACVRVYRKTTGVTISDNTCKLTQNTLQSVGGIEVIGTGGLSIPDNLVIRGNIVSTAHPGAFGIQVQGFYSAVISDNVLIGSGLPSVYGSGIYVRATALDLPARSMVIKGNLISNFGRYGILVSGNGAPDSGYATLFNLTISENTFDDTNAIPTMTIGARLDDGTKAAKNIVLIGNSFLGGVSSPVTNFPAGSTYTCLGVTCP